jgi:DNA-binding MarR family transcriptional regulator
VCPPRPPDSCPPLSPFMDVESRRDLQLLEAIEQESTLTQRTLAERLGIALGLTNLYLKRLIRKGHVKCVTVAPNRLVYLVTPRGVARKARLTYEFMKYSLDLYRDVRHHLRRSLADVVTFLGLPVHHIERHREVSYDVLIIAVLERPAATRKRLGALGVAPEKLLMLQAPQAAPPAASEQAR